MQTTEPIKLCDAKVWWTVYSSGVKRGRSGTWASSFPYYNDACTWAQKQREKGFDANIVEEHAIEP